MLALAALAVETTPRELAMPAVVSPLYTVAGRTEIAPVLGLSLGDAFFQKGILGLALQHHFGTLWSVGPYAAVALSRAAPPLIVCNTDADCQSAQAEKLAAAPGNLLLFGGFDVRWAPLYGKLSLLAEDVLHFDAYLALGPAGALYRIDDATMRLAPGLHGVLGQRVFLGPRTAIGAELADLAYIARVRGSTSVQSQLMLNLTLTWLVGG